MNIKISIIIPVYNVEPYIERCLLSALNQTYQNLEIILIDDCGQDNSMSVARAVAEKHPNGHKVVFLKHEQNRGLSAARNTGIEAATGDYVYFLDSDDEITLDCIETLVNESEGFDVVIGAVALPDGKLYFKNIENTFTGNEIIRAYFSGLIYSMAWNKLLNTMVIKNNKLYFKEGLIHEDYLWTYQTVCCVSKVKIIDCPTYIYHIRPNTLNTNFTLKNIKHYLYSYNIIKSHTVENYTSVPMSNDYIVNFAFLLALLSVRLTKCSYQEYKNLKIFDIAIKYTVKRYQTKIKILFFKLPEIIQYLILKYDFYYYHKLIQY